MFSCNKEDKEQKQCDHSEALLFSNVYLGTTTTTCISEDTSSVYSTKLVLTGIEALAELEGELTFDSTTIAIDFSFRCLADKRTDYNVIGIYDQNNKRPIGYFYPETQEILFSFYYNEDCSSAMFFGKPEA